VTGYSVMSDPGPFGFAFPWIAALLIAAWIILAGSRFVQGGNVERPERIPQLYGYTACLIGLIMGVMAVLSITEAALSLRAPEQGGPNDWSGWVEPSVTSFEAFRATYDRAREMRAAPNEPKREAVPEEELRRRYEGLRTDRLARTRIRAQNRIVTGALSLLLGIGLFTFHWRWLRRRGADLHSSTGAPRLPA
jgi:hypothetical protein